MKKITLLLLTICNVLLFAQSNRDSDVTAPKAERKPVVYKYPTKAFVTLQDYYNEFNAQNLINPRIYGQTPFLTDNVTSQQFDAGNSTYTANAADDFKVPANKIWNITAVNVNGYLPSGNYPTAYNVTFYSNSGTNLPGTVIRTETVTLASGSSSPSLPLATTLSLTEGTYWISVQAVMDLSNGQWFWSTYNDAGTLSRPFAWKNPGGGFGSTCSTTWNTASICIAGQLKDLQFSLDGTESAGCKVFTGRILTTDPTHSPRINRNGVHSVCGTAKAYPGDFGSGNFHYKTYSLQNTSATPDCVTLILKNADPDAAKQVHLVAYTGSFNPANISQNYLGDIGNSSLSGTAETMSVTIPGNTTIVLVATEPVANTVFTADFTITVLSANCGTLLKTVDSPKGAVNVYPNPTTGVLFVNGMQPKQANVFDVSGKLIPTKVEGNKIDTQKLPKGNYILKMEDKEGKSTTTKFIKK
ncbi:MULTISPECIES: T9SS type A sorting domain-containing protein [unclassified Kaistella]|uniref:T9SS type A sorting domain-containing protein n=1 Tax=unclassified Kaistella TaxID=2762626 RepID=UPI0027329815|nr:MULTISPECIES: T9SS type A sorting domain-containing protein [unclassified Kaistella]MDP2454200.1 T9SS type A sorting domain-containing protein [Kaistella sp. SH11-4b]MDP2457729.1 T9SS type A sorting domain-containing protein [Kaistella sp. SH40-3]MDP2460487.1 T9SS type A sorting domain-containing protein [Kaistella sp. SH19-2b]